MSKRNPGTRSPHGARPNSASLLWTTMLEKWGSGSPIATWIAVRSRGRSRRWRGRFSDWLEYAMPQLHQKPQGIEAAKSITHVGAKYKAPWKQRMREQLGAFGASVKKILRKAQT
jgi:hypothetical protein